MQIGLEDATCKTPHEASQLDAEDDRMKPVVVQAVVEGSHMTSPFLHGSTSIDGARKYRAMGESVRNEKDHVFVRIDLNRLIETKELSASDVIDMSDHHAIKKFFTKPLDEYGTYVVENFSHAHKLATSSKEILIKWRGSIPLEAFEVVNEYNGSPKGWLMDLLKDMSRPGSSCDSFQWTGAHPTSTGSQPSSTGSQPTSTGFQPTERRPPMPSRSPIPADKTIIIEKTPKTQVQVTFSKDPNAP